MEHSVLRLSLCRDCIVYSGDLEFGCVSAVVVVILVFFLWVDNTRGWIASFKYLSPNCAASSDHTAVIVRAGRRRIDPSSAF